MKASLLAAFGLWLAFVLVFVTLVGAQSAPSTAPASKSGAPAKAPGATRLLIPGSVNVDMAALKAGAAVKASVENKGGQKVVTAIQVN
jgi:hypothetical protein